MLFQNESVSLRLDVTAYELPEDAAPEDRNWLVLRAAYTDEDGQVVKDSSACLLAGELETMTAGLKVLNAGVKDRYDSEFTLPYFTLSAAAEGDGFRFLVTFSLPNSMDIVEDVEVSGTMDKAQMKALVDELDQLRARFPERG